MRTSPVWSPEQYGTYADERGRPYADLVGRVRAEDVRTVVDLGCGPGGLTVTLREVWPEATIVGVDNSPQMLAAAEQYADDQPELRAGRRSRVVGRAGLAGCDRDQRDPAVGP